MRSLTICLLVLIALVMSVVAYEPTARRKVSLRNPQNDLPCFVVVSNHLDKDVGRAIKILMDSGDVSEESFVRLHRYFSTMYPHVKRLSVDVRTKLTWAMGFIDRAEDLDLNPTTERKPRVWEKDAQGILTRRGETEFFRYKVEGGDLRDLKTVLVKGKDPDCLDCKNLESEVNHAEASAREREKNPGVPCYFVIETFVMDNVRFLRIFINGDAGNRSSLLALWKHLSGVYPNTEALTVKVYTSLDQENLLAGAEHRYFVGGLFRNGAHEVLRYRRPREEVTTIVLQGTDIFPNLDDRRGTEGYRVP